ncbi:MAG: ATP-binding protein [Melioribacteraceae bacterium]|nr:ATP-binding protein [Melioribacteraceae bacterium]
MNYKQLIKLIEEGENLRIEFKQKFSEYDKIAKEIIAFANTEGGTIIFGVTDKGRVLGVESEKEIAELVKETIRDYCQPSVDYDLHYIRIKDKEVVALEIHESKNKPHRIKDFKEKFILNEAQVFIRVRDKSVPASKEMIKLMQNRSLESSLKNYSIGKNEKLVFNYLSSHDYITAKEFSKIANLSSRRASRTLINLVRADILAIHTKENGENFYSSKGQKFT